MNADLASPGKARWRGQIELTGCSSMKTFEQFFEAATGHAPYDYQRRLACGELVAGESRELWLNHGTAPGSKLINIPTGLGKTAAVIVAWLWNRVGSRLGAVGDPLRPTDAWPRRLVYCLPMRTLVEQTEREVLKWLTALDAESDAFGFDQRAKEELDWLRQHSPVVLMGGEDLEPARRDWDIHPEKPCILIGTQDMFLSRALNRGYGMSRYRWPMHFALLNNDCLWVMDETQLMGVGVETSAQLDGFRNDGKMPTLGTCPTWWMSATLEDSRLATVDHPKPHAGWPVEQLSPEEKASGRPHKLFTAAKTLVPAPFKLATATADGYARHVAELAVKHHQPGTLTLVVVNRVKRAQQIYEALTTAKKPGRQTSPPLHDPARVALVHSRFRRADRQRHEALLFGEGDRIVVATQAVEAGVDVSAQLLIIELAPWSSIVQRLGRCNRRAEFPDGRVLWTDIEPDAKGELLLPYSADDLKQSRAAISSLEDASPQALAEVKVAEEPAIRPVIRRRDLVDLFDTTPDLCGQDLDISRYIRDGEDNDVQLYWREVADDAPLEEEPAPTRVELCRVSIGDASRFFGKTPRAWRWNPLLEGWEPVAHARPGGVYLVDARAGGYDDATGWTGDPKDKPTPHTPKNGALEAYAGNPLAFAREWQTIAAHTAHVIAEAERLSSALSLAGTDAASLRLAALWHDVGKAHPEFQKMLRDGPHPPTDRAALYAKSKNPPSPSRGKKDYRMLRHELASALAWLLAAPPNTPEHDLVAYLIAAHHGKVRLSIRSLPNELAPDGDRLFARGIWDGDTLPPVPLGETTLQPVTLDLSFMQMGEGPHGPSWLARAVALRDRLGPFRLAGLETLLRIADARASALAPSGDVAHSINRELAGHHRPLAATSAAGQSPPPLGEHPGAGGTEHGFRGRAGELGDPARSTRPERATRCIETTRGVLSYSQLAPLLAGQVVAVQADIERGVYGPRPLEESLLLEFHRRIAGDLVPEWAGRWRAVAVQVGNLQPPPPHAVPVRMHDYCRDLQARWPEAAVSLGSLTLEFLAFAEGRFLTVHPFQDFNGRVIRLFLSELLRRLDLPPLRLEAEGESERAAYFAALEAADQNDFRPLLEIWKQRLAASEPPTA